jgi:serine/threonine-protein kinase
MEHVTGRRLGDLVIERGGQPAAFAVALVGQILAGLHDAHANGIVHSDVKCDNVLVQTARDGSVVPRLIDFGIARFVDGPHAHYGGAERVIAGTPAYLAPELIRGEVPTFASDVYAAGVLLYELVTGAPPFAGGTRTQVLRRQLRDQPMPLSWWASHRGVPAALDAVVARALAKEPAERFADAGELGAALSRLAPGTLGALRPVTWPAAGAEVLSTEATTARMSPDAVSLTGALTVPSAPARPGSRSRSRSRIDEQRQAICAAIREGDVDAIALAYLELARVLLDAHRLGAAIAELEEGVELLSTVRGGVRGSPLWRLLLSLAALYDGTRERARARILACAARDQAVAAGSAVGRERAEQLWTRLARGDPRADGVPPAWYRGP